MKDISVGDNSDERSDSSWYVCCSSSCRVGLPSAIQSSVSVVKSGIALPSLLNRENLGGTVGDAAGILDDVQHRSKDAMRSHLSLLQPSASFQLAMPCLTRVGCGYLDQQKAMLT
jgi:hypothetical protein